MIDEYWKVYYKEDNVLKCARYSYDNEHEALKVAYLYSQKEGVTEVQVYKYEVVSSLVKQFS